MAYYIKFKDLLKIPISERGKPGTPLERIQEFKIKMPETMKFWPRDAMDKIENEEDKQFLLSMQNDRKASMSGVDKVLHQKEMRKEKREQEALRRAEKERQCKDNEKTCTQVTETESDESDEDFQPSEPKQSHRHSRKTGEDIHIPFNILKSPQLVSTAVRNNISPTALSATMHSLITSCKGDPSKLNLHHSQAYR